MSKVGVKVSTNNNINEMLNVLGKKMMMRNNKILSRECVLCVKFVQ
jgi:hypothetical protein